MTQGELFPVAGKGPRARAAAPAPPVKDERPDADADADTRARLHAVTEFRAPLLLEAGAGTGKTATLVARVLHWCLGPGWDEAREAQPDASPERVAVAVARGVSSITFTEAAAAEMSTRVGVALASVERIAADGLRDPAALPKGLYPDLLPPAAALAERSRALRAALDHLGVSTIHAFCRRLLAAHPLEVGFDPAFEVDATMALTERIVREVLEEVLAEAWSEPIDADLLALALDGRDAPRIEAAVVQLATDDGARAAELARPQLGPEECSMLVDELRRVADDLAGACAPMRGVPGVTEETLAALDATRSALAKATPDAFRVLGRSLDELWTDRLQARLKCWRRGKYNKREGEAVGDAADEVSAAVSPFLEALEPMCELDPERLERVRRVLHRILERVEAELRRRGVATFSDLLDHAERLLREHPDIAAAERTRIRQLLVDEFQDTDDIQCRIVAALAFGGDAAIAGDTPAPGLFLVGDPKQSIFAWRNADLAAYHAFAERVRNAGGEVLELSRNFRSTTEVLDEVERVLDPVLEPLPGVQPPFAALVSHRGPGTAAPAVEYWLSWPLDPGTGRPDPRARNDATYDVEARALVRDLIARRREGSDWKHLAVIFRSLTAIDGYLEELRRHGVPYEVQSDRKYYRRREILDATALVRALLDPDDHLALVALLRSPLVGLPDAALMPLWDGGFPGAMSHLVRADTERLAEVERSVHAAAARVPGTIPGLDAITGWEISVVEAVRALAELRHAFHRLPVDEWIERVRQRFLPDATEAARFLGAYRLANLERFFRDLRRALDESAGDVPGVLRTLRANLAREDRSEASRPADSARDAVQVLTIHGAKGLEFRHVYLAQCHKGPKPPDPTATELDRRGGEPAYRLLGEPNAAWFRARRLRDVAEAAERARLLYVALTRACDRLVVMGAWPPTASPRPWRTARTFIDLLGHRAHASDAVTALIGRAAAGDDQPWLDPAGVAWRLAESIAAEPATAVSEEGAPLPARASVDTVRAESERLAGRRAAARKRGARPFSTRASAEGHEEGRERRAARRFSEDEASAPDGPGIARGAAQAAGTIVHRILELVDLEAPLADQIEAAGERIDALATDEAGAGEAADAAARAREVLAAVVDNGMLERLANLAPHVVARELPVLLPADGGAGDGPVGFVSGSVDLLYRDPRSGELVVADYKTDPVMDRDELAARAASYLDQGRAYVRAVYEALALEKPPRFELWFLSAGEVVEA